MNAEETIKFVLSKVDSTSLVPYRDRDIMVYVGTKEGGKKYKLAGDFSSEKSFIMGEEGGVKEVKFDTMFWDRLQGELMDSSYEGREPNTSLIFPPYDDRGNRIKVPSKDLPYIKVYNQNNKGEMEEVDGRVYTVAITCQSCGNVRYVKPQDEFQVTKCKPCTYSDRRKRASEARKKKNKEGT